MSVPSDLRKPAATSGSMAFKATLASLVIVEIFSGVIQVYFTPIYSSLGDKFGVDVGTLSWALTGFTLSTAVCTPLLAKLGDVYGHSRILKIEVAIATDQVDRAIAAIVGAAKTGQIGDGKIFVISLDHAVRIRTGEADAAAL